MKRLLLTLLILFTTTPAFAADPIKAKFITAKKTVTLKLELATTPAQREQGLMNRTTLAPNDGMLFQFPTAQDYAFWMKNTTIPLDMLFLDADRKIVYIAASTTPNSLTPIHAGQPVTTIIELDGSRATTENINVGDKVEYEIPVGVPIR